MYELSQMVSAELPKIAWMRAGEIRSRCAARSGQRGEVEAKVRRIGAWPDKCTSETEEYLVLAR